MSHVGQLELVKSEYTISLMKDDVHTVTKTVDYETLTDVVLKDWSPAVFDQNYRKQTNFLSSNLVVLDIDDGMSVEQAIKEFDQYKHIIATSKSHQVSKNNKPPCDRFRVVLFLENEIKDRHDFKATLAAFKEKFADPAALEPARRFYPCKEIVSENPFGEKIPTVKYIPKEIHPVQIDNTTKGNLSRSTLEFLTFLAPPGMRHGALIKAAVDACEQGYTQDEFVTLLEKTISQNKGVWVGDQLSDKDLKDIEDMYSKEEYALKKREKPKQPFTLQKISDIEANCGEITWIVDQALTQGGCSILAADPKAGKSTLARQLAMCVSKGIPFLGRQTKQGSVLYFALEEQQEVLVDEFRTLGVTDKDPILIHVGDPEASNPTEHLQTYIEEFRPALVILDTLQHFTKMQDVNSYTETNNHLRPIREAARKTKCHILMTHHNNKSDRPGPKGVSGSSGIHGAVDNLLTLTRHNNGKNSINSFPRNGVRFDNLELRFDEDNKQFTSEVVRYEMDDRKE